MVIWIVEDSDDDARKAYDVVVSLAREKLGEEHARSVKVYRVSSFEWPPELLLFDKKGAAAGLDYAKAMPAIVVLDLFEDDVFKAGSFFQSLRQAERTPPAPAPKRSARDRSFVIFWTVQAYSEEEVGRYLHSVCERDERVGLTHTKSNITLRRQLEGFWRQWEDEKYP